MARQHGKILTSIWIDRDFTDLTVELQWLYEFLISQPDLTFAGTVPLRPARWAGKARNLTLPALRTRLTELEKRRYIVTDGHTGELLIRTFIRNDGVFRQPKVMIRCREEILQVESPRLWTALLDELHRLPLDELSNTATPSGGPPARKVVQTIVHDLQVELAARLAATSAGGGNA